MPIRPENKERPCDWCGTIFAPYRGRKDVRWCSRRCKKRTESAAPRQVPKPCIQCGALFTPIKSAKQAFCTPECKTARRDAQRTSVARLARRKATQRAYARTPAYRVGQRSAKARRRAAVRAGSVTVAEWNAILDRYGHCCAYCAGPGPLTMDHVTSLARGGAHAPDNLVPACQPCNSAKGTADWSDRLVARCR